MRVLIADDNQDAADSLAMVLRLWGHEARVVYDGLSALQVVRNFNPHAVLLDIELPRVTGGEVALNLRRQSGYEGKLIVAISASDPDDPRLARYEGVFDAFLGKPYDFEKLAELLAYGHTRATLHHEPLHVLH
jgi:DNA-binding response OmpR family regulator